MSVQAITFRHGFRVLAILALCFCIESFAHAQASQQPETRGSVTNLPLPRFVSLKTSEVVTVLGRYHRGALAGPRVNVGAILEQREDSSARLSVVLFAALSVVLFGVGCSSVYAGLRTIFKKKPKDYFDEPEL